VHTNKAWVYKASQEKASSQEVRLLACSYKVACAVKKDMHLIMRSSTRALVTMLISTTPKGGFHCKSVCMQMKPAQIDGSSFGVLWEVELQTAK